MPGYQLRTHKPIAHIDAMLLLELNCSRNVMLIIHYTLFYLDGWMDGDHFTFDISSLDIDECSLDVMCHDGQECENTIGAYRCVMRCGRGFRRTADGLSCSGLLFFNIILR